MYRTLGLLPQEYSAIFTFVIFIRIYKTTIFPGKSFRYLTKGIWVGVLCPAFTAFKARLLGRGRNANGPFNS